MSVPRKVPSFLVSFTTFFFSVSEKSEKAKRQRATVLGRQVLALAAVLMWGSLLGWSRTPTPSPPPSISSVAWSPDGNRLATGSDDSTAKVWDLQTGKELLTLSGLHGSVLSIAWSPDGKRLATGSFDNTAKVWEAETGKELLNLDVGRRPVWSVAWNPDGTRLATGSVGRSAKVWDVETGKELVTLNKYDVHSVAWSPDGERLATGSEDYTAKVWDAETGKELLTLDGPTGQVSSLAWSPDGKRLATGSRDSTAKVWDARTGKELMALSGLRAGVWSVAWSPDGRRLAAGSDTAQVRDAKTGKELLTLRARRRVFSVAWSPDGKQLATGGGCNTTEVWDAETGKELLSLNGLTRTFHGCKEDAAFIRGGPTVTLGIEITLPDRALFYIPAVGDGEMLGIVPLPKGRFAGIRIIPRMRADSVEIEVSALARGEKKLSEATSDDARLWKSEEVGSYEGNSDTSLLLSGLGRLGLPVFTVKVVQGRGPPPGPNPEANSSTYSGCGCNFPEPRSGIFGGILASGVGGTCSSPEAGKCVEVTGCGQCCRMSAP